MLTSLSEDQPGQVSSQQRLPLDLLQNYRVELAHELLDEQGQLIDWLIGFAFDTVGARVLDLRVVPPEHNPPIADHQVLANVSV